MTQEVRFLAHHLLHAGLGPLDARDRRVLARLARRVRATAEADGFEPGAGLGQRLADRVAAVGGSWGFILAFCTFLVAWAALNALVLGERAFDPYPFVFLNLILSMVAALQAPVIMMSQNRQAAKDRLAAALAYEANLRAEADVAALRGQVARLEEGIALLVEAAARADAPAPCLRAA